MTGGSNSIGRHVTDSKQQLIRFKTRDGFELDALLLCEQREDKENLPIVIHIHGVLGHFLARGTPRLLPPALLEYGIQSLSVNTRMAFMGQIMGEGIFDDAVYDIEASVSFLKAKGFKRIFILGYSLGANLSVYYAATRLDPCVKGLILEGCAFSLPDSHRKRLDRWKSIPSYEEICKKAVEVLGEDPYRSLDDRIFLIYRAWGPTLNPFHTEIFTYKTWWFMRGPKAYNAMAYRVVSGIKIPVLFLQGENDDILEGWEAKELARLVVEGGNTNVKVRYISKAGHDCMENPEETVSAIVGWVYSLC